MTVDEAAEEFERLVSGDDYGVVSVRAGRSSIYVQVSGKGAGATIKSSFGTAYHGFPIVIQRGSRGSSSDSYEKGPQSVSIPVWNDKASVPPRRPVRRRRGILTLNADTP